MKQLERSPVATTKFTAVNVTPDARDALRLLAVTVSAKAGRRVSMSAALLVVADMANAHPELIAESAARLLSPDPEEES